jgi:acetyltransferase-like isoleucine patch superfamily enzyme
MNKRHLARLIAAAVVSLLPLNSMRCAAYRKLFKYDIRGAFIGLGTLIVVDQATFGRCWIGKCNRFLGPMTLKIGDNATVGPLNEFICGFWTLAKEFKKAGYRRQLQIGEGVVIACRHYFDLAGSVIIGDKSWVAGRGSQFWTHGAGIEKRDISIGKECYVGSAVRFAPGASVPDYSIVGLGSVVTSGITESRSLIAGIPARVIKRDYDWRARLPENSSTLLPNGMEQ